MAISTVAPTTALRASVDRRGPTWTHAARASAALTVLDLDEPAAATEEHLAEVAGLFGLSDLDARLLRVALLAELHPSAHLLLGLLSGDDGPARPTVALAMELAGASVVDPAARDRLGQQGPLVRHGLLDLDGDDVLLARRLRVPDRVVARLLGSRAGSAEVTRVVRDALPVDLDGTAEVAAALVGGEPLVWVHSPVGTAGIALAVAACRQVGVECLVGDLERLPVAPGSGPDPSLVRSTLRALVLEAGLERTVLVLAGAHLAAELLGDLESAVPVLAVGRTGWDPRWSVRLPAVVVASRLNRDERAQQWLGVVGEEAVTRDVLTLRMTPEEIVSVGRRAEVDAARAGREATSDDVRRAARRLGNAHGPRVHTSGSPATLDDLVLPPHTRREVERLIGWARDRDEVLALGELQGKGGKGTGIAALFSGSPGTGKTLAAHVVADSLGMDLFQVDLSSVVDKYIGETEKNLERVFTEAEALNAVLFFDEADALFGSRSEVNDAHDRYANQEVAYLLQRMEAFDGHHGAGDEPARQPRPRLRPPAALHRALPRPRRAHPAAALAAPPGPAPRHRPGRPDGHRRSWRSRSRWPAATSATSSWRPPTTRSRSTARSACGTSARPRCARWPSWVGERVTPAGRVTNLRSGYG